MLNLSVSFAVKYERELEPSSTSKTVPAVLESGVSQNTFRPSPGSGAGPAQANPESQGLAGAVNLSAQGKPSVSVGHFVRLGSVFP